MCLNMTSHCHCLWKERVLYCIQHKIATYIQRLLAKQRHSSCFTLRKAWCSRFQSTEIHIGSSGLTHWKIRSVIIREVECASYCNNSSPDDPSCLKFRLEDAKVHQVILHRSKICVSNRKHVLNTERTQLTIPLLRAAVDFKGSCDYSVNGDGETMCKTV